MFWLKRKEQKSEAQEPEPIVVDYSDYRQIYNEIASYSSNTPEMLRAAGICARGSDTRDVSVIAMVVYLAHEVKRLKDDLQRQETEGRKA